MIKDAINKGKPHVFCIILYLCLFCIIQGVKAVLFMRVGVHVHSKYPVRYQ